ncbi:hypothetical protein GG344DRAFT_67470 [Lentinula edodes]|nr:hypothetical protein GG344DRAFT_67470 [Lentinula edodes]
MNTSLYSKGNQKFHICVYVFLGEYATWGWLKKTGTEVLFTDIQANSIVVSLDNDISSKFEDVTIGTRFLDGILDVVWNSDLSQLKSAFHKLLNEALSSAAAMSGW